jgi:hypothetical protein
MKKQEGYPATRPTGTSAILSIGLNAHSRFLPDSEDVLVCFCPPLVNFQTALNI